MTFANAAAVAKAAELTGVIQFDSAVVIIRVSDEELIDGVHPNDHGRYQTSRRGQPEDWTTHRFLRLLHPKRSNSDGPLAAVELRRS